MIMTLKPMIMTHGGTKMIMMRKVTKENCASSLSDQAAGG